MGYYAAGGYYRAGGFFKKLFHAVSYALPFVSPIQRKLEAALLPAATGVANRLGLGGVLHGYEAAQGAWDAISSSPSSQATAVATSTAGTPGHNAYHAPHGMRRGRRGRVARVRHARRRR